MSELKDHFSKHREVLWQALRKSLTHEREWTGETLRTSDGPFTVTLDVHAQMAGRGSEVVTRLRAAYINRDGFLFGLKRRSWVTDLTTFLGEQDVQIGDEEFDRDWVIKTNNPAELRRLLARPSARMRLSACTPIQRLEVRDDEGWFGPEFPGEVDELYLEAGGRICDADTLGELYSIFAGALSMLCQVGSAYESDPEIEL